ncbi:MAG: hypothetical protein A3K19_20920 [Lentisphaerae bacterium RIFOXYB12_FULL_65_16]|nr:MAG: hypothetical protein A3K18_19345 [Lentisphaerae bacterium RIFOXYA12_64_32]OGV85197.1 MAG: hypothetical protein A3K19_20920 [Lentisphaerae bacterium RIFOXYB12_FULL_65_16]
MPTPSTPCCRETDTTTPLSARILRFQAASQARQVVKKVSPRKQNFDTAFFARYARRPFWERYARATAHALEMEPVYLVDDELLVGMLYQLSRDPDGYQRDEATWAPYDVGRQAATRLAQSGIDPFLASGGAPGHIGWRWDMVLELGVEGIMARIRRLLAVTQDPKAKRLYRGALILWRSVLRWNQRHIAALKAQLETAPDHDQPRLRQLIEICSRVPRFPARTFHEAVQSFHLQHLAVMFENPYGGNSPGRLDYFLWPYLERDIADGATTWQQAKDLIDELFIRFEERLHPADGWVESVIVGGTHPDGRTAVNPLSNMMIHSIMALKQTHPVVYPRIGKAAPAEFVELCARYLVHGENRAQIYNDDACIPAIVKSGTPAADAAMYMAGGCMEISAQGMNCDLNFARIHNVAKTFELVLNGGMDLRTGKRQASLEHDLTGYDSFEALYAAFENELLREYTQIVRSLDIASKCYAEFRPCYLLSSLVGDCLERGREQQDGGARYHEYGFAPLGITSVADALTAIKRAVFVDRKVTASELLDALRSNYQDAENLRRMLRALPKYGMENADADAMCNRVMNSVCNLSRQPKARFGGQLKPMIFNFVWTPSVSATLGARADGARAGDLIGHGMTPQGFAMTRGITAAMNSCAALDCSCVSGGAATMWDMDHEWITVDLMRALLAAFVAGNGMIFQGNTTAVADIIKARENPDAYPDLIVRVGGFSARFVTLEPALQDEIINRRRHAG